MPLVSFIDNLVPNTVGLLPVGNLVHCSTKLMNLGIISRRHNEKIRKIESVFKIEENSQSYFNPNNLPFTCSIIN